MFLSIYQLKQIPPHCLEGLRVVYSQLEVFTCSKSLSSLEVLPFRSTFAMKASILCYSGCLKGLYLFLLGAAFPVWR